MIKTDFPDTDKWPAFIVPWDDTSEGPTDMSFLLHKPAGTHGFIQARDGHFYLSTGARWKIWGQNMTLNAPLPPTEAARIIAGRMAKYGINCIRLHHIDHRWPEGILIRHSSGTAAPLGRDMGVPWDGRSESTRFLDPEAMNRLDWFIHCCKEEGIYIDLNLNVSRIFTAEDGVKDSDTIGFAKAVTYFDRRLIQLQKEYARQLLTHLNPFTGLRYADDPGIALVEILNENSLLAFWMRNKLNGQVKLGQTWGTIPSSYIDDLNRLWNMYLQRKYPTRSSMEKAWGQDLESGENHLEGTVRRLVCSEAGSVSSIRFTDEAAFYQEIEQNFFKEMKQYLKEELGCGQLIVGTSDCFSDVGGLALTESQTETDVIDGHAYWNSYWDTPNLRRNERSAKDWYKDWHLTMNAMVDHPEKSLPVRLSRNITAGKPFIVSEINEHFPSPFACECLPVNTAYALLQDWDGIFWFGYAGGDWEGVFHFDEHMPRELQLLKTQAVTRFEWMCSDPLKMIQSAQCALMFLRGDLSRAKKTIRRNISRTSVLEDCRSQLSNHFTPYGFSPLSPLYSLIHRIQIDCFHAEKDRIIPDIPVNLKIDNEKPICFESDTGEIIWHNEKKYSHVIISSEKQLGYVGYKKNIETSRFIYETVRFFSSLLLSSLDGKNIESSESILCVACSMVANTGMNLRTIQTPSGEACTIGNEWGQPPTRVEPGLGRIILKQIKPGKSYAIQPLDGRGQPLGLATSLSFGEKGLVIDLKEKYETIAYHIKAEK